MNLLSDFGSDEDELNVHEERVNRRDNLKKARDSLFAFLDEMEIRESAQLEDLESDNEDGKKNMPGTNDSSDESNDEHDNVDLNSSQVEIVSPNTFRKTNTNNDHKMPLKGTGEQSSTGGTSSITNARNNKNKAIAKLEKIGEVSSQKKGKSKPKGFSVFGCCAGDRE